MVDKINVESLEYSTFFDNDRFNRNKVKESWIKRHYPIEYSNINTFCLDKKIKTDIFSQKLFHYIFKIDKIPICLKCESNLQRYGGFNIGYNKFCSKGCASSSSFKNGYQTRIKNTIKRYGVSHTTQLKSVKEKMKSSNLKRYGVEFASQNINILNKMKETNMEKYGVEFPLQNQDIRSKINFSEIRNSPELILKIKENSLRNYGVEWPIQSEQVKNKIKKSTNLSISEKIKNLYNNHKDIKFISYENGISFFSCLSCHQEFTITSNLLYQRHIKHGIKICTHCNKMNDRISNGHIEICEYLKSIGVLYEINVRNIISPYEIDIYLPDYKIGIEFNGVYWHSEIIKNKNYHFNKRKQCLSVGIDLIQIWEDDWKFKTDIVKSIISSRIGKSSIVKGARKLEVQKISNENTVKDFLSTNHIQGWSVSGLKYGLFENDELISISTFSKNRINVNNKEWELVRFCNKLNHTVMGSFNRLMNKFITDNNPKSITSYSDNDLFNGKSYKEFTMLLIKESLNYWWCDGQIRHNRWKFRKDELVRKGNDRSLSGTEIMIKNGYFRCWGSGTSKWEILF